MTHHLYPDNPHMFVVDIRKVVTLKGEPNTSFWPNSRGEQFWKLVIYTSGLDSDGNSVGPYWFDLFDGEETLNEFVNAKIKSICLGGDIDWSVTPVSDTKLEAGEDRYAPIVSYQYPANGQTGVPIDSGITLRLKELLPGLGIDLSSVTMTVDGFSINPRVEGNPYDCTVYYRPTFSK